MVYAENPSHQIAVVNRRSVDEEANARLIAAAPALLETLEALVSIAAHIEAVAVLPDRLSINAVSVINEARAAVALAKGESK
jgi:hypothetical protein